MIEILIFGAFLVVAYWQGWHVVGMIVLGWAIFNSVAAAFMAVSNPGWYVRKRQQSVGDYPQFSPPDMKAVHRDITNLLLTKIVTTIPLAVLLAVFAQKAGFLG